MGKIEQKIDLLSCHEVPDQNEERFYCSCLLKSVLNIAWAKNRRDFMEVSWNKGISRRHEIGSWIVWICCEIESKLNWKFIKVFSIQTCSINAKFTGIFYFLNKFDVCWYDLIKTKILKKNMKILKYNISKLQWN